MLFAVTKIDIDMRTSNYAWDSEDDTSRPPLFAEFIEHENPVADKSWGSWAVNDDCGVDITETRCVMCLGFLHKTNILSVVFKA